MIINAKNLLGSNEILQGENLFFRFIWSSFAQFHQPMHGHGRNAMAVHSLDIYYFIYLYESNKQLGGIAHQYSSPPIQDTTGQQPNSFPTISSGQQQL